jgi:hypothetical protein
MRTTLSTLMIATVTLGLSACLSQPLARARLSTEDIGAPSDSVVLAYEAGRRDAGVTKTRGGANVVSWLAFPAGVLAAKATGADWMRAATALAVSTASVGVAYHRRTHAAINPPDSLRARWSRDPRIWDAYRRGYQAEVVRDRRTDLNRASEAAGGTILSYGVAPLFTKSNHP